MALTNNNIAVVELNSEFENQTYALLNKYEESSLMLLANLKSYGPLLTDDSYSGNFKCLVKENKVVAVFVLTRVGNLLLQTDHADDYSKIIIAECLKEPIPLHGVIGAWELAAPALNYAQQQLPSLKEKFCRKGILFRITLDTLAPHNHQHDIRYLQAADYPAWALLNKAYMQELHLALEENENARYKRFLKDIENKFWLGLFLDNHIVAITTFTLQVNQIGQIGGVYALPTMRKQGLAKALIYQQLLDGKINKHMAKVILFTSENNNAAIRLYESLGFNQIGYFGLTVQLN